MRAFRRGIVRGCDSRSSHRSSPCSRRPATRLPEGDGWQFEPKWDGFRALVFRDGDELYTQSRDLKPLDRYFPELAEPLKAQLPERCVLDGEVVIARDGSLQFELLLLRIHPAASRVRMLAAESPASFVAWDLLALGDEDLRSVPQGERRARLEAVLGGVDAAGPPDAGDAGSRAGGGLVRPVRGRGPRWRRRETPRRRLPARQAGDAQDQARAHGRLRRRRVPVAQERARHARRVAAAGPVRRRRHAPSRRDHVVVHVGAPRRPRRRAGAAARRALDDHPWGEWAEWAQAGAADASGQRLPGATSRWNRGKDLSWEPLRTERVVEVAYDHLQGDRFRHATTFRRWRPDKQPSDCRYDQLETTDPVRARPDLRRHLGAGAVTRYRRRAPEIPLSSWAARVLDHQA